MAEASQLDNKKIETVMESAVMIARQRISEMDQCVTDAGEAAVIEVVRTAKAGATVSVDRLAKLED